jgi:NADH dehydrogenase
LAVSQDRLIAAAIRRDLKGQPRGEFQYHDKGQMATIGRSHAITQIGKYHLTGLFAWFVWLVVHIYYLTGFKNRLFVVISWAWSFFAFRRGARLIVGNRWKSHSQKRESALS